MKGLAYHPHLVSMLGWVADQQSPLLLVELCEKGDLLHFIREKKTEISTVRCALVIKIFKISLNRFHNQCHRCEAPEN